MAKVDTKNKTVAAMFFVRLSILPRDQSVERSIALSVARPIEGYLRKKENERGFALGLLPDHHEDQDQQYDHNGHHGHGHIHQHAVGLTIDGALHRGGLI